MSADLIDQLRRTWASLASVGAELSPEQWRSPTDCPGWDVRAQVSHVVGTEAMLLGRRVPPFDGPFGDEVHNDIGRFNQAWIVALAELSDAELLAEFVNVTTQRLEALEGLPAADWEAEGDTPVGRAPYRRFMEIRVFDSWIHEQDVRFATGIPGHDRGPAVERSVDEVVGALGYVVGKRARAPEGSRVRFAIAGAPPRTIDVAVDGRARVVLAGADDAPTVTLATDAVTFVRLGCGRVSGPACLADGSVTLAGDRVLGEAVAGTLAFTV